MTRDPTEQEVHVRACIHAARTALCGVADAPREEQIVSLRAADAHLVEALYGKPKLNGSTLSEQLAHAQAAQGINSYREAVEDARVALPLFDDLITLEQALEVFANLRRILGVTL